MSIILDNNTPLTSSEYINNYWKVILVIFYCSFTCTILITTGKGKDYWESACLQKDSEANMYRLLQNTMGTKPCNMTSLMSSIKK